MDNLLLHFYNFAEIYAVLLCWVVVPLSFAAAYLYFVRNLNMGAPIEPVEPLLKVKSEDVVAPSTTQAPEEAPVAEAANG